MAGKPDKKTIEMACLADLGRARQDDLPLSDKQKKGPSYAPGRRNGTDHIPPVIKKGLKVKWKVALSDAEAEQMEGLKVADARPWAKKMAKDFMARNAITSAPPKPCQYSKPKNSKPKSSTKSLQQILQQPPCRPGGLPPPQQTFPKRVLRSNSARQVSTIVQTPQLHGQDALQQTTLFEADFLYFENLLSQQRNGHCAMKVYATEDCAFLIMIVEGISTMKINVVDISSTHIWEKCLLITAKRNDKTITWGMQFMTLDVTSRFKKWLDALRLAATPISPDKVEDKATVADNEQPEHSLIDFSTTDEFDYEGVAKQLQTLVARIIPECTENGLQMSNDAIHEIEETIIASWRQQGFLKNVPDNIEAELLEVLRSLLRFKRKAQEAKSVGFHLTPTMKSLMELQLDMQSKPKFIKYSAKEIEELRSKASNGLESSRWALSQTSHILVRQTSRDVLAEAVKEPGFKTKQGLDASYWAN
ncbi:hypothetical protein CDD81_6395 [Ophiocordyceps australis]|uniref:PH domain-containing protein n=1 Tax=Ophiocordyceps australis TaxID=1399860 RepID=A0A2C5Y6B7_9HYPO|nr:hypothetical protein CDD81_6395 [Ophiocordyceps australis]